MREVLNPQFKLSEANIANIEFDPKSRDDIPKLLIGLQHIYITPELREEVFTILAEIVPINEDGESASTDTGRPGMAQWTILVLGVLRLGLNADFDRIHELANQHSTIRSILGLSNWCDGKKFSLQSIKDNLMLFTPELLDRINQCVVKAGHRLLKKDENDAITGRCDSFVVETRVHYPTDINLLFDAVRKTMEECAVLCEPFGHSLWRQYRYNIRQFKKLYRKAQKLKHSTSKDEAKQQRQLERVQQAHQALIESAQKVEDRARQTRELLRHKYGLFNFALAKLDSYLDHVNRQIDQIRRRILEGEKIPHTEKVFSIFQPHTEWICKGKAGVPVELGLRVCIMADSDSFILHHQVMEKQTDDKVAVAMVEESQNRYAGLNICSFDKGFHSKENQEELKQRLALTVLPKKGRLSKAEQGHEYAPEFVETKRKHSAVEAAINGLEVHGLDTCRDHGLAGFKRYSALAVVAKNIHRLGALVRDVERKRKRGPYKKAA